MPTNGVSQRSWVRTSPAKDEAQTSRDLEGHAGVVLSIIASDTIEIAYKLGRARPRTQEQIPRGNPPDSKIPGFRLRLHGGQFGRAVEEREAAIEMAPPTFCRQRRRTGDGDAVRRKPSVVRTNEQDF
jgi:hypothetical protein